MFNSKTKASMLKKIISLFLVLILSVLMTSPFTSAKGVTQSGTNYPTIFVNGYAGFGQYDKVNDTLFKYWGMQNGDLLNYLNSQGFECYAASVDPVNSAWDRACELYAQLTGGIVDYGEAHAAFNKHSRFGTDYSKCPLVTGWGERDAHGSIKKLSFVGHSFGGVTVRLLAQLMTNGSDDEVNAAKQGKVSALFTGGKMDWIYSITTVSAPHNGTTAVNLAMPFKSLFPSGNTKIVGLPISTSFGIYNYLKNMSKVLNNGIGEDTGIYDLSLDGAALLNKK